VLRNGGGYAEEISVNAAAVVSIPGPMDFVTAAAFPVAYGTSQFALTQRGHLQANETLLVLGAAGGVGLTAVEIGKILGARVIAAAGGPEKLAIAREHGADEFIDYRQESIRDRVRALTDGKGVDVVFDPVGGDAFDQALRAVNWEARMLVIGFAGGRIQAVPANLILVKNISVIGVVWGAQAERAPVLISSYLSELLSWWEAGKLKPVIAKVFPLARASDALTALLSRQYVIADERQTSVSLARSSSARKPGSLIAIIARARSASVRPRRSAMPCSVTTQSASARGVVTTASVSLATMRERVRSRFVDCSAIMDRPPAARLAARIKSICPPTAPICRPRAVSAFTWPVRSTSSAPLIATKRRNWPRTSASCVYEVARIWIAGLRSANR